MTIDELRRLCLQKQKTRKPNADREHRLQCACVAWFRARFPQYAHALFAVPNGGRRDGVTGARLKAEGVIPGIADLVLLKSNARHGALLIEMKTPQGRQSPAQQQWQKLITADNRYKYVICRSLEQFIEQVTTYLSE